MGCGASADDKGNGDVPEVPSTFPIKGERKLYENWDRSTLAQYVLFCEPTSEDEIIKVANWAAENQWTVRPVGIKHNWSPITIVSQEEGDTIKILDKVVLVSLMEHMTKVTVAHADGDKPPTATVQLGCNQERFLTELENAKGGPAHGYGIIHTPAPNSITIGGLLAIDGHGTAVPCEEEDKVVDRKIANYGTYSNLMLACRAVVFDAETKKYTIKEFRRDRGDEILPFLAHVGKAFLTEATLQVVPNYNMRCISRMDIDWKDMFAKTPDNGVPQENTMMHFIKEHGRAEAIWFPFTDKPWLKIWHVTGNEQPEGTRKVDSCCNYPFSDELGENITKFFRSIVGADMDKQDELLKQIKEEEEKRLADRAGLEDKKSFAKDTLKWFDELGVDIADGLAEVVGGPSCTPFINKCVAMRIVTGLLTTDSDDIWGPSKNTLIYVKDTTLKVTANGYAVMTTYANVQECIHVFAHMYRGMLEAYQKEGKYPIACPLEIRVTGVDDPAPIGGPGFAAATPPLSALQYDEGAAERKWECALWLDVLSLPGAAHSSEFYAEMETKLSEHEVFNGEKGRIRPEWSKGWGYTKEGGPWKSKTFLDATRQSLPKWNEMMDAFEKHDEKKLFTNPWMDKFFVKV